MFSLNSFKNKLSFSFKRNNIFNNLYSYSDNVSRNRFINFNHLILFNQNNRNFSGKTILLKEKLNSDLLQKESFPTGESNVSIKIENTQQSTNTSNDSNETFNSVASKSETVTATPKVESSIVSNKDTISSIQLSMSDFNSILQTREEQFIQSQRKLLQSISKMLNIYHNIDKNINKQQYLNLINKTIEHLNHLFLIIVVGEFNSGKSRFLNAVIGEKYLKEGKIPTTEKIDIIRYGAERSVQELEENPNEDTFDNDSDSSSIIIPKRIHYLNKEFLKGLSFIDSPGVNATITKHEQMTKDYIPRADLVIFLTSVERPFSESEREFLLHIREWKKKIIVVVNKSDLLSTKEEKDDVQNYVRKGIKDALGFEPRIFFVSAKNALERKIHSSNLETELFTNIDTEGNSIKSKNSVIYDEWDELENYIINSLNINQRIKLKLLSPIGIAEKILQRYSQSLKLQQESLIEDFRTIETIEQQLTSFKKDLIHEYSNQQRNLDILFNELVNNADEFIDAHITAKNLQALIKSELTAKKFDDEVVSKILPNIQNHINNLIDWTQEKNLMCWKSITDFVYRRAKNSSAEEQLIGTIQSEFNFNKKRILNQMSESYKVVVDAYDSKQHIKNLRDEVNSAFSTTSLLGLISTGIGSSTIYIAASQAIAVSASVLTGGLGISIAAAGAAAYTIPYKRQALKKQFREKSFKIRDKLKKNLEDRFEIQINEMNEQIRAAIAPYSYYVERRKSEFDDFSQKMEEVQSEIQSMRENIEKSYPEVSKNDEKN